MPVLNDVDDIKFGSEQVDKIYLGSNEIWSSFSPLDLSPALWFDASDDSSFTYSTGVSVSQWNDLSGNNRHATNAVLLEQPSRSTTLNGRPTVSFDGTNDKLLTTSFTLLQPNTVYTVFRLPSSPSSEGDLIGAPNPIVLLRPKWGFIPTQNLVFAGQTGLRGSVLGIGNYLWGVHFNGASSSYRLNRSTTVTGDAGTRSLSQFYLARQAGGSVVLNVEIAEIVICNRTLSLTEISGLESYLANKWGL